MKYNHNSMLPIGAFKPRGSVVGGRSMRLHGGDSMYVAPEEDQRGVFVGGSGDSGGYWEAAPAPAPAPVYNEPAPAPAQNWTQTVNDIYQQEFGRQADPSGLASFTNLLNQGLTGEQMREALRTSPEGQSMGLSPAATGQGIASLPTAYTPFDEKQYGQTTDQENEYINAARLANWQMERGRPDLAQQYINQANVLKKNLDSPYRIDTFTPYGGGDSGGGVSETVLVDRNGNIVSSITPQEGGKYAVNTSGGGDAATTQYGGGFTLEDIIKQSESEKNTPFGLSKGQAAGYAYELKNEEGEPFQRYDAKGNLTEFVNRLTGEWTKASDVKPIGSVFDPMQGKFVTEYQYGDNKFTVMADPRMGTAFAPIMDPYSKDTGGFMGEGGWAKIAALVATGLSAGIAGGAFAGAGLGVAPGTMTAAQAAAALGGTQAMTLGAVGTAAAQGALANIAISGFQGATPAEMLKAGLIGAVSGGAGSAIGTAGLSAVEQYAAKVGLQTGLTAASGGDAKQALINGIITNALPIILNEVLPPGTAKSIEGLPKSVQTVAMSAAESAIKAGISGQDISDGAVNGVINGLVSLGKDVARGAFKDLSESELATTVKDYFKPNYEEFQALPSDGQAPTIDSIFSRDTEEDFGAGAGDYVIANIGGTPTRIPVEEALSAYQKEINPNATMDDPSFQAALAKVFSPDTTDTSGKETYNPNAPLESPFQPQLPASEYDPVIKALEDAGLEVSYKTLDEFTQDPGALVDTVYPVLAGRQPTEQERINFIDQYSNSATASPQDLLKDIYDQVQLDKQIPVYLDQSTSTTPVTQPPVQPKEIEPKLETGGGGGGGGGTLGSPSESTAPSSTLDEWFADSVVGEFQPEDYLTAPSNIQQELLYKDYVDSYGFLTQKGVENLTGIGGVGTAPGDGGEGGEGEGPGSGGGSGGGEGGGEGEGEGEGEGPGSGGGIGGGEGGGTGPGTGPGSGTAAKAAAKRAANLRFNNLLNLALQSNQLVAAKTPPGAEIDYLYDIGGESIFAPMRSKSKYEPREGYYDPKVERPYAEGGFIDDYTIDDLYELLRGK
jgi:hypothetical protein